MMLVGERLGIEELDLALGGGCVMEYCAGYEGGSDGAAEVKVAGSCQDS